MRVRDLAAFGVGAALVMGLWQWVDGQPWFAAGNAAVAVSLGVTWWNERRKSPW